jgi:hypothetical protein
LRCADVWPGATGRGLTGKPLIAMAIDRRPAGDGEGCGKAGPDAPADPGQGVAPCDQLWLTLTNRSGKAQDVSVLYYATDFTVSPIWPHSNLANRLQPGESVTVGLQIDQGSLAGLEEIWVLAVPEADEGKRIDLTRLSTPQMTRAYAGASSDMALWIEGRMIDPTEAASRGFSLKPAPLTMIRQVVRLQRGEE